MPYASFEKSAQCLDYKRLGKQRVEAWQIYRAIVNKNGWSHHPIVRMWKDNVGALLRYGETMCLEWRHRGYVDNMLPRFRAELKKYQKTIPPKWVGNRAFHRSHKSNLLRKFPEHYSKFRWNVSPDKPYVWM